MLIRALPAIRQRVHGAALVIVGGGPYRTSLRRLAHSFGVADHVVFTDGCPATSCPPTTRWPTCSRCRAAPAARDSTSKGWASSSWRRRRPACRSWPGGPAAPRKRCATARPGVVVDGWDVGAIAARSVTCSPTATARRDGRGRPAMGGRQLAVAHPGGAPGRAALTGVRSSRRGPRCRWRTSRHDLALDLHRRRQLAGVLGEVDGQDAELADRLRV